MMTYDEVLSMGKSLAAARLRPRSKKTRKKQEDAALGMLERIDIRHAPGWFCHLVLALTDTVCETNEVTCPINTTKNFKRCDITDISQEVAMGRVRKHLGRGSLRQLTFW